MKLLINILANFTNPIDTRLESSGLLMDSILVSRFGRTSENLRV